MVGRTLSHYQIVELLGAGGMGVVYRAHDQHLERDVAIKVLPSNALADETSRKRFRREALALSKLSHPHICTVYDFDSQDGIDFLVMELLPGAPLADQLRNGPLPEPRIIELGAQIAEALEAAHEQGVIHRDLKPGNIFLTPKGHAKVLDFGLAKLVKSAGSTTATALTETNAVTGTLAYMAPEQLLGGVVDERSDVYALGVVLYEMATGRPPHEHDQPIALANQVLHSPVPPPRVHRPGISAALEAVILRCLQRNPEARYPSARDLVADLRGRIAPLGTPWVGDGAARRGSRFGPQTAIATAVVVVVVAGALLVGLDVGGIRERLPGLGSTRIRSLVVLPLANLSRDPEQEYFVDGMTDELINELALIGSLKVISRTSAMRYKDVRKTLPEIARELKVDGVIEGSVARQGSHVRILAKLVRAHDETQLWTASFERDLSNVIALQTEMARIIAEQVRVKLTPGERARLARSRSVNPQAHEAYLRGRHEWNRYSNTGQGYLKAIEYFERALQIDPNYALAHAGIGEAYAGLNSTWMPAHEAMPKARDAALRALAIDSTLSEAHTVLAYVQGLYDWDWTTSGATFRRAIALNPNNAAAHTLYSYYLLVTGRFVESGAELGIARDLDPLSSVTQAMTLWPLNFGRQYDQAIAAARDLMSRDSTVAWNCNQIMSQAYLMKGEYDQALEALHRVRPAVEDSADADAAMIHARAGNAREARRILARVREAPARFDFPWTVVAQVYGELRDMDQAFECLDKAIELKSEYAAYAKVDPRFDAMRGDPRFDDVLRRLNLGP